MGDFKNRTMTEALKIQVTSETGPLEAVILHRPGPEVENMTPANAERALYSDILNLSVALEEYGQLEGVLKKVCRTFQVKDLLTDILHDPDTKEQLVRKICFNEGICQAAGDLIACPPDIITSQLIEGVPLVKDNLSRYLSVERYLLRPLHNLFFTRDTTIVFNNIMIAGKMATRVRERESLIMEAVISKHPLFIATNAIAGGGIARPENPLATLEGGDVLVARNDVLVIGSGLRTSTHGIDTVLEKICESTREKQHIIVQELPTSPESFIHLDMIFTILDSDACMVYEPVIFELNRYKTIHIEIDNGSVTRITQEANIVESLKNLGMDLEPIACGGSRDSWIQEREQWHSGANFFAFAPGTVIGYARNVHTLEEMNKHGFEIITANDVMSGIKAPSDYNRCVVTIAGSELARGGGGARCMSLPIRRAE